MDQATDTIRFVSLDIHLTAHNFSLSQAALLCKQVRKCFARFKKPKSKQAYVVIAFKYIHPICTTFILFRLIPGVVLH